MNLKNKKVLVFGLGLTGQSLVKKLNSLGAFIVATDLKNEKELSIGHLKKIKNITFFLGSHPLKILKGVQLILVSPGVPLDLKIFKEARKRKIPILGEIEFASKFLKVPIIAITGTNGKSTTTAFCGELLKKAGFKVAVGGNIGKPLISINSQGLDYVIAEISSYQLESIKNFNPLVSVILNITPDHLKRHHTLLNYARLKSRIFKNHTKNNFLIYNYGDSLVKKIVRKAQSFKIPFCLKGPVKNGIYLDKNKRIVSEIFGKKINLVFKKELSLPGDHNVENFLAGVAVGIILGVKKSVIKKTLQEFKGLAHRIEFVRELKGVKFYNDSKATNPDSTIVALKALSEKKRKKIILIAGGEDKGTDLKKLSKIVKETTKAVILFGQSALRFEKNFKNYAVKNVNLVKNLAQAVKLSFLLAKPGDVVLFSPACASFDMFRNFEHRGEIFKKLVKKLKG